FRVIVFCSLPIPEYGRLDVLLDSKPAIIRVTNKVLTMRVSRARRCKKIRECLPVTLFPPGAIEELLSNVRWIFLQRHFNLPSNIIAPSLRFLVTVSFDCTSSQRPSLPACPV